MRKKEIKTLNRGRIRERPARPLSHGRRWGGGETAEGNVPQAATGQGRPGCRGPGSGGGKPGAEGTGGAVGERGRLSTNPPAGRLS